GGYAFPRRHRAGKQHARPLIAVHRSDRFRSALSAGAQCLGVAPDDRAFHLRVSLWPDALRPGPHREHAYILEPKGRGGGEEPHMKGVNALFLGMFGTFAFSWTVLTLIPNFQIGPLAPHAVES